MRKTILKIRMVFLKEASKKRFKRRVKTLQFCHGGNTTVVIEENNNYRTNLKQIDRRERAKVSSSYKEHRENALASGAEEGRDKLR